MKEKEFLKLVERSPKIIQHKLGRLRFLRERPDFHPEESTYEHIKIVTIRLMDTKNINLILSGLLHDICKFECVELNKKTGYPTTPGHADKVFDLIQENEEIKKWIILEGGDVDKIANICFYHMRFCNLDVMSENKRNKYIKLLNEMDIWFLLEKFSMADNMLRPWMDEIEAEKTLLIIRGLPGAGKSTLAKEIAKGKYCVYFEADMYWYKNGEYFFTPKLLNEAHQWCKDNVENSMIKKMPLIIVSNTSTRVSEMQPYIDLANIYGYKIHSIIVENRHDGKNIHGVPDEKLEIMKNRFEIKL